MTENARVKYDAQTMPALAREWRGNGDTLEQIAARLGVDISTLYRWRVLHRELAEALHEGTAEANTRVEEALLRSAEGFHYDEVVTECNDKDEVVRVKVVNKYRPPSISAQKFWLINRTKGRWKNAPPVEDEHFGEQLDAFTNALLEHAKAVVHDDSGEQNQCETGAGHPGGDEALESVHRGDAER